MNRKIPVIALLIAILCISFSITAFAETNPVVNEAPATEAVVATEAPATEAPVVTEAPTQAPATTAQATDAATEPQATTAAATTASQPETTIADETTAVETTVIKTNPPEPTEPDEDSTYSDYVSPAPVYTPAEQDFKENDWKEIQLDLGATPVNGKNDFAFIQENNAKGNDSIMHFLIIGVILLFLSIAGFTFVFLYRPNKATAAKAANRPSKAAVAERTPNRQKSTNSAPRRRPDDYDDGYY